MVLQMRLGLWLDDLHTCWHIYRLPILLLGCAALLTAKLVDHFRRTRQKLSGVASSPSLWDDAGGGGAEEARGPPTAAATKDVQGPEKLPNISDIAGTGSQFQQASVRGKPSGTTLATRTPKRVQGNKNRFQRKKFRPDQNATTTAEQGGPSKIHVLVFYFSLTGHTESCAKAFVRDLSLSLAASSGAQDNEFKVQLHDLSEVDYDDYFVAPPKSNEAHDHVGYHYFYVFLVPTYDIDTTLNAFLAHLQETHHDFRIDKAPLSRLLGYSVFGFGDRQGWPTEPQGFCSQATQLDKWMAKLTAGKRAFPLGFGDVKSDAQDRLREWRKGVEEIIRLVGAGNGLGTGVVGSGDPLESDEEEEEEEGEASEVEEDLDEEDATITTTQAFAGQESSVISSRTTTNTSTRKARRIIPTTTTTTTTTTREAIDDVEELGRKIQKAESDDDDTTTTTSTDPPLLLIDFTTSGKEKSLAASSSTSSALGSSTTTAKEMVPRSSATYAALTKQGYTIVGSHSGVKICRWTKSALRGRGSCYKFSFYGIKSHLCMETTPSLSCSNKCVFCWRHGTNPVGTTWRWAVDPPDRILAGAKEGHYQKIRMMRGVPGVRADRFAEAFRIRHCALSLVGEPIFYPHINRFVDLLHGERISTFLVCNAQHPDQLAALTAVTQLYVSIDASNRESLRRIDRPLHRDFWERFQRCMDILRQKRFRQRTVFRLTLVKGFNIDDEVPGYADLIARALPGFVEIKGVTFCGTSTSSSSPGLRMSNVPFYSEVAAFVRALKDELDRRELEYGIAAEHEHSCCVLVASKRFLVDGRWHTLIDYDRFFHLLEAGADFSPEDYMGPPTPEWALWGNGGFDPADQRVFRKKKT